MKRMPKLTKLCCLILTWALALALTSCEQSIPPYPERPPIPANLLVLCPKLHPLDKGAAKDVGRKFAEVSEEYYDCADRHAGLVEAVK